PRVAACALLIDRDRGGETIDLIDLWLLHQAQELPSVRAERLDVSALALGVDRIEGQAALARSRYTGDDDELVAGDLDVDVLEVVLARTAHDDSVERHE